MIMYMLSSLMLFIISIFMLLVSMFFMYFNFSMQLYWKIIMYNCNEMDISMYFDWMSLMFLFLVTFISSMILLYSIEYMSHDFWINRFLMLMLLFILSMVILIISSSMIMLIIGWDGLGLISFCLVIYYQNFYSKNCGMITLLTNRIGDVMIILSMSIMFMYNSMMYMYMYINNYLMMLMLLIAAFSKSAQFPFSSWLPMAMAAPTPVSSLVHSSTLVTAGVYLMIRFNFLLFNFESILKLISLISLITMVFSGLSACMEFDMKKIIAYSTLSQLSIMFMIFSKKNIDLTFFHLVTHAMFKSMLFMCSGILIHMMLNYQDIRYLGMLKYYYPNVSMMMMIGNMSLCGMPFMSGFYSKDLILENLFMIKLNIFEFLLLILGTLITLIYSIRLMFYLFNMNFNFCSLYNIKENKLMSYSMMLLVIMSMFLGSLMNWLIFMNIELIYMYMEEKMILFMLMLLIMLMFNLMIKYMKNLMKFNFVYYFGSMWFLYNLNNYFKMIFNSFMNLYFKINEKGWNEYYLKNSVIIIMSKFNNINKLNFNNLMMMMMMMFIMFMILIY